MSLNNIVSAERVHISFFGMRNAGKSSVVNAVTGQALSLVSDVKGTTTDPVSKAMELLPIGPVVIIDTPGIDDEGELGKMRVERAVRTLDKTDVAVLVVDSMKGLQSMDKDLIARFKNRNIPYILVYNKSDIAATETKNDNEIAVSAKTGEGIYDLKELIGKAANSEKKDKPIISDLVFENETAVLVIPIDAAAPKGRIILPQQQTLRELLDTGAIAAVTQVEQLRSTIENMKVKPKLVVTDSQAFKEVDSIVPRDIALTSFSILFARYKGELDVLVKGAETLKNISDGDKILISEGCTHHRQCGDIGTEKLPRLIRKFTGKEPEFEFTSGREFPGNPSDYSLVIHCGGCMLNEREMKSRIERARESGVPMTNYGVAIALMNGILSRALSPFDKEE